MELDNIINIFVNNSVSIALLIYFVYKDNKFMTNLEIMLTTLKNSVDSLKDVINENRGGKK